jgi:predicted RND superfamily exporter protein
MFESLNRIFSRLSIGAIRKSSYVVLVFVAALAVSGTYEIRKLDTTYSLRQFMPKDHPLYVSDRAVQSTFSLNEELPVIVTMSLNPEVSGTWLQPDRVETIRQATQDVAHVDGIKAATSLVNIESAASTPKGIQISNLLSLVSPEQWKDRVLSDPLLSPSLISQDGRTVSIFGDIGFLSTQKVQTIVHTIRGDLGKLPGIKVLVGGVVPIQSDMALLIGRELQNFLIFAFLACFITLVLYFRTISSTVICLILVVLSNIGALALMPLMGNSFSVMSTTLPVLASITALAIGSHTLLNVGNRWEATRSDPNPPSKLQVIGHVYRILFLPNFLMSLTTTIGFATLAWSEVPLIREFARSVSGGILVSWLIITIALPPLMVLFPVPRSRRWTGSNARWALWAIKFRYYIFSAVIAIAAGLAIHGMPLNWAVRLFDDLPEIGHIHESAQVVDNELGGMTPLDVMVHIPNAQDPWNEPANIDKLNGLLVHWRKNAIVGSAIGLPDFLHNARTVGKLDTRQSVAEIFFLYGLADGNPLIHFLTSDGSTRMSLRLHDLPADQMQRAVEQMTDEVKAAFPGADIKTGGMATMVHSLNAELSQELITGLWQSLFWISLLLIVVFRSIRWSLIAAVPNLLAPLALLATMSLLKTPIKPTVAVIFSIALGVAYNNTVYLLARLKWLGEQSRTGGARLIDRAWYQEGNPCLFSSLALFGGFAVFLGSYFSLNRVFGAYMLWSIGVGLFGDLIFLPVLLRILPPGFLGSLILPPKSLAKSSAKASVAPMVHSLVTDKEFP